VRGIARNVRRDPDTRQGERREKAPSPNSEEGPSSFARERPQPTSSRPLKKKAISMAAFSSLSEPWTALRPLLSAQSLRTVPSAASYAGPPFRRGSLVSRERPAGGTTVVIRAAGTVCGRQGMHGQIATGTNGSLRLR
jgi:hypothetical protein